MDLDNAAISDRAITEAAAEYQLAHLGHGVVGGAFGAAAVALIFLGIDSLTVGAFATPNALGRSLFLSEPFTLKQALLPEAIVAYTALHALVFVAIAYFGAALLAAMAGIRSRTTALLIVAAAIFCACQAMITSLAHMSEFPAAEFSLVRVAYANALASLLVSEVLLRITGFDPRLRQR